jgi:hypothetical protein
MRSTLGELALAFATSLSLLTFFSGLIAIEVVGIASMLLPKRRLHLTRTSWLKIKPGEFDEHSRGRVLTAVAALLGPVAVIPLFIGLGRSGIFGDSLEHRVAYWLTLAGVTVAVLFAFREPAGMEGVPMVSPSKFYAWFIALVVVLVSSSAYFAAT